MTPYLDSGFAFARLLKALGSIKEDGSSCVKDVEEKLANKRAFCLLRKLRFRITYLPNHITIDCKEKNMTMSYKPLTAVELESIIKNDAEVLFLFDLCAKLVSRKKSMSLDKVSEKFPGHPGCTKKVLNSLKAKEFEPKFLKYSKKGFVKCSAGYKKALREKLSKPLLTVQTRKDGPSSKLHQGAFALADKSTKSAQVSDAKGKAKPAVPAQPSKEKRTPSSTQTKRIPSGSSNGAHGPVPNASTRSASSSVAPLVSKLAQVQLTVPRDLFGADVYRVTSPTQAKSIAQVIVELKPGVLAYSHVVSQSTPDQVIDVIELAFEDKIADGDVRTPVATVLWDLVDANPSDRVSMLSSVKRIFKSVTESHGKVVLHNASLFGEAIVTHSFFDLGAVVDTAFLFSDWRTAAREANALKVMLDSRAQNSGRQVPESLVLHKDVWVKVAALVAQEGSLASAALPIPAHLTWTPLSSVLAACNLPRDMPKPEHKHLVKHTSHVQQLLAAVKVMQASISQLVEWNKRAKVYLAATLSLHADHWLSHSDLPKVFMQARFTDDGQLQWRDGGSGTSQDDGDSSHKGALTGISAELQSIYDQFPRRSEQEFHDLLALLPARVREAIQATIPNAVRALNEVILDLGEPARVRCFASEQAAMDLKDIDRVTQDDIDAIMKGRKFSSDRRGGIEGQLHRISWIANREGKAIGLTIRVGRACPPGEGVTQMLLDLVKRGESVLFLGKPGSGKTHTLRDFVARLSDSGNNVMIVDTSNEIGGAGDVKHFSLHKARRLQVRDRSCQHEVLLEAVQNHTPDILCVDEISDAKEVTAARSVAPRIAGMVATAHGDFESILRNKVMRDLLGGLETSTVGDSRAKELGGKKSVTTRAHDSLFSTVVELVSRAEVRVFRNVNTVVDAILDPRETAWVERRRLAEVPADKRDVPTSNAVGTGFFIRLEAFERPSCLD